MSSSSGFFLCLHLGVGQLDQHIGFDVDGRAGGEGVEVGAPVGEGQDGDGDGLAVKVGDGEADAFNGD